jgi:hypothetical protein
VAVTGENVVSILHGGVAGETALGVVALRRLGRRGCGRKRIRFSVILERAPAPPAAVREPLAILHREVDILLRGRNRRSGKRLQAFGAVVREFESWKAFEARSSAQAFA